MTVRAVEGKQPYTGGTAIEIDENKVISLRLRDENNLIIYDAGDNEIYVDLQLPDELTPTDAFPVGITTGRVIVDNGWDLQGTLICAKTTSGDNIKLLYADEGTLWIDNGTGTFKQILFKSDVDGIITTLTTYINGELAKKQNGVTSATAPANPAEGDLWYDTTRNTLKVYNGSSWVATGGGGGSGDVVVSTDTGNELSTGVALWFGTESDFSSISTPDTNTLYIQYVAESGPTPEIWATNLVGYRPLQSDANDHKADVGASGTTYDGTWSGTATYGAVSGRTGASFSNNSYIDTGVSIGNRPLSYALSLLKTDNGAYWRTAFGQDKNSNPNYGVLGEGIRIFAHGGDSTDSTVVSNYSINTRYNIVVTTDGSGTIKYYLNGSLVGTKNGGQDIVGHNWCIAKGIGNYCNGAYVSHCAIWDKELSADEVSAFNTYIS